MAKSPFSYTQPAGTADVSYFQDTPLTPAGVENGELAKRFDTVRYPANGKTFRVNTSVVLVVTPASPQLAATSLTFTATVTASEAAATPVSGTVEFFDGATSLGVVAVASGSASRTGTLALGTHTLTAVYSGDGEYGTSTSPAVTHTAT